MFFDYVRSKKSWIFIILGLLFLTNALILLDKGISVARDSLIYLNGLSLLIFIVFFVTRYQIETAYYKQLKKQLTEIDSDWFERLSLPARRLPEFIVYQALENIYAYERQGLKEKETTVKMDENDLASWVHEMKTPLTAMKITLDGHPSNELAKKLNAPWLRMYLLLDRQLYMSRLPRLDADLLPERVVIQAVIKEEIRELSPWFMEKNISVELTGLKESEITTDKKWVAFMLRQILTNAIKYSPAGRTLHIDLEQMKNSCVQLTVKDAGPGIQVHDLPRVFDKGFTGENGRLQHASTGMGLYLAKQISEKLQIKLAVDSEVGKGTAVSMTFSNGNPFERIRRSAE